jgi:hypothetical protein
MLLGSQAREDSGATLDNSHGAFTGQAQAKLDSLCAADIGSDHQVSMHALVTALSGQNSSPTVASADTRGLTRQQQGISLPNQNPIINGQGWTDCFIPYSPTGANCAKSFKDGEFLETTAPTDAISQTGQSCALRSGTKVQALESKTGISDRLNVEVPASCGFSIGGVPMGKLRNDGSFATQQSTRETDSSDSWR